MSTARSRGSARTRKAMLQLHAWSIRRDNTGQRKKCKMQSTLLHCRIRLTATQIGGNEANCDRAMNNLYGSCRQSQSDGCECITDACAFSQRHRTVINDSALANAMASSQCAAKQLRMQLASNCIVHIMIHVTCGMPLQRGTLAAGCIVDSEHGANMLQFICKWFANAFASCSQCCGCLHCPVDNQTRHTRRLPFYPQPCTKMFKCFVTTMRNG